MDDTVPLLMASPLPYGTEPETVTFDETAVPIIIPATAERIRLSSSSRSHNGQQPSSQQQQQEYYDPLLLRASVSHDSSGAQSDKPQEPVYQDVIFALLFWLQLAAVIAVGYTLAPKGYEMLDFAAMDQKMREDPTTTSSDIQQFETFLTFIAQYARVYPGRMAPLLLIPTTISSFLIACLVITKIIRPYPKCMVTMCLLGAFVDTALVLAALVFASQSVGMLILSILILSIVAYYVGSVWRFIPYSAVNLGVSLEGIQSNFGIYIVAMFLVKIGVIWAIFWLYTLVGVEIYLGETMCPGMGDDEDCGPQGLAMLLLLLSFYWTTQVITNAIQVTVAGVMATWCFDFDDASSCCSMAVWSSLYRTFTFSFGSICLGSLLMGLVRVLRYFVKNAKKQRDNHSDNGQGAGMILCLLDCLIKIFEEVLEYFNHFAFIFCGVYGTSYLQSGKMVFELFKARGWDTFISDDVIGYVLAFTTFSVGILTGLASVGIELLVDSHIEPDPVDAEKLSIINPSLVEFWKTNESFLFGPFPNPTILAFCLGFLIGLIVCSIMMSVVRGAVNTLIVCYADSPARLQMNHPDAVKEMSEAWSAAYPAARINLAYAPAVQPP